jgi:hypothetical protein
LGSTPDRDVFARWAPGIVKIVTVDNRVPYLEDVPAGALILVRNHPMSEDGNRGAQAEAPSDMPTDPAGISLDGMPGPRPPLFGVLETAALPAASGEPPESIGARHARQCQEMALYCESKGVPRSRLLFEGLNEPQLWSGEPPAWIAAYYRAFLIGLHNYNLHGVVGNFGVGWPGNGGVQDAPVQWEFFRSVINEFRAGDFLGLHEYWALNGPNQNWRWWAGRFLQCPYQVPILITETGIDTGVTGQWYGGWRDLPGGSENEKAKRYSTELVWYAQQCYNDGRVKQVFTFTYDIGSSHWEKFDIRSWAFLDEFFKVKDQVPNPPPPPPPPPPTGSFKEWLLAEGEKEQVIQFNPSAALQKAIFADGFVPNSPEFRRVWEGAPIVAQRAERLSDGVVRVYYAREGEWDTVVYEQR